MSACRKCLLPAEVPGSEINETGLCAPCRQHLASPPVADEERRREYEADLEQALVACRGEGEYDCLVNLSGGKDSCYLLYKLVRDYRLKVLAFTTDMNVPPVALVVSIPRIAPERIASKQASSNSFSESGSGHDLPVCRRRAGTCWSPTLSSPGPPWTWMTAGRRSPRRAPRAR